jgi:cytochrome c
VIWLAAGDGSLRAHGPDGAALGALTLGQAPLVSLAVEGGRVAAGGLDGRVTVVEAGGLVAGSSFAASSAPIWSLALDAGAVLAAGADNVVRRWDAASGTPLAETEEVLAQDVPGEGRGAEVFRMCAACHTLDRDDGNRAGPTLHGIFGRPIASAEGFAYSPALSGMDLVWTPETVAELFRVGPAEMTPGTTMPEQRIGDPEDRAALIEFLETHTR